MANGRRWVTLILCFLAVTLVFWLLHYCTDMHGDGMFQSPGGRPGLLLYMLPGFILCPLARDLRVLTVFAGALAAAVVCQSLHILWMDDGETLVHVLAYTASMVFWCVFGALLYWFGAMMYGGRSVR